MLILFGQGQGHLQAEFQREGRAVPVDGPEGHGSLEAVGITHGESPYWHYGGSSCVLSAIRPRESLLDEATASGRATRRASSDPACLLGSAPRSGTGGQAAMVGSGRLRRADGLQAGKGLRHFDRKGCPFEQWLGCSPRPRRGRPDGPG